MILARVMPAWPNLLADAAPAVASKQNDSFPLSFKELIEAYIELMATRAMVITLLRLSSFLSRHTGRSTGFRS